MANIYIYLYTGRAETAYVIMMSAVYGFEWISISIDIVWQLECSFIHWWWPEFIAENMMRASM